VFQPGDSQSVLMLMALTLPRGDTVSHRLSLLSAITLAIFFAPCAIAQDGATLMRQAEAQSAAGHSAEAAKLYEAAANAFNKAGNFSKAGEAFEMQADALIGKPAPAAVLQPAPNPLIQQAAPKTVAPPLAAKPPVQQAQGGGKAIAAGVYNCHGIATNTLYAVIARVEINGSNYIFHNENDRDLMPGTYSWNGGAKIHWTSGFLSGKTDADWEYDNIAHANQLTVYTTKAGAHYAVALICYLSE
jgi:hypothetical protein